MTGLEIGLIVVALLFYLITGQLVLQLHHRNGNMTTWWESLLFHIFGAIITAFVVIKSITDDNREKD